MKKRRTLDVYLSGSLLLLAIELSSLFPSPLGLWHHLTDAAAAVALQFLSSSVSPPPPPPLLLDQVGRSFKTVSSSSSF